MGRNIGTLEWYADEFNIKFSIQARTNGLETITNIRFGQLLDFQHGFKTRIVVITYDL